MKLKAVPPQVDGDDCLRLEYPFGSIMWGLIDAVRRIDEGVFLGQVHLSSQWPARSERPLHLAPSMQMEYVSA